MFKTIKKLKEIANEKTYESNLSSFDYCQLELEYAFKKSGNINNNVISDSQIISIKPEPSNKFDSNAVAVYMYGLKIGYIKATDTQFVRRIVDPTTAIRLYYYNETYRAEIIINYHILRTPKKK